MQISKGSPTKPGRHEQPLIPTEKKFLIVLIWVTDYSGLKNIKTACSFKETYRKILKHLLRNF